MDIKFGSVEASKFLGNVGLITSNGKIGHNIMSAEWTRLASYSPGIVIINLHKEDATTDNIKETGVFGVNIASEAQNVVCSVAGGSTGAEVDKIKVLEELGVRFRKGTMIDVLMVDGAALNIECRVIKQDLLGDHVMFIGEVVDVSVDPNTIPIIYSGGKYYKFGDRIQKPDKEALARIGELIEKYRKG